MPLSSQTNTNSWEPKTANTTSSFDGSITEFLHFLISLFSNKAAVDLCKVGMMVISDTGEVAMYTKVVVFA
mgnify:CR=1 FL=1